MSSDDLAFRTLQDQIKTLTVRLAQSRREPSKDVLNRDDICQEIEACARQIADLSTAQCQQVRPLLLALVDEVNQTTTVFQDELGQMRRQLTSADQSRVVGAAYRQLRKF